MAWVKLDDQFFVHRKSRAAGLEGRALFLASVCYCAMQLNDGVFLAGDLEVVAAMAGVPQSVGERLVDLGLWHTVEGGYEVHGYLDHNPSREQVLARKERAEKAAAARYATEPATSSATSSASSRPDGLPLPSPSPSPEPPPSSSTSDSRLPADLWTKVAEKKAKTVTKPIHSLKAWTATAARNARDELEGRALSLVEHYELTTSQLVDVLMEPGNPPWLAHHRRKESA